MNAPDPSETFRQEAAELLEQLEQALLDLEQDPTNHEPLDSAFRALHTIKGSGAMFGFEPVAVFTHDFETAFDRLRKGKAQTSHELIAVALLAKDHIRTLIQAPEQADAAAGEAILRDLQAIVAPGGAPAIVPAGGEAAPASPPPVPAAPPAGTTWRLHIRLPRNALTNGTNPLLLLDELRTLGECVVTALIDEVPPLDDLDAEACYLHWEVVLTTTHPRSAIDDVFIFVIDDMTLSIERVEPDTVAPPSAAPPVEVAPAGVPAATAPPPAAPAPARATPASPAPREAAPAREAAKPGSTSLRVPAERLDELMDRVGELVITQARLSQLAGVLGDANLKSVAEEIERLASGLRDTTMGIRMVPIGSLFGRFRRVVHDLSRDLGKQVELVTSGEETELDKTMIERLADPLVHLIRNAIDHGLEAPPARIAAGKPAGGQVRLTARHAGAEVLVSLADDGRGLDRERILAKCREQGLLTTENPPDSELFQFIFHPGFSTAKEISAVSGRGVGMDVVKQTIEALRGAIDLVSRPGQGTEVTLRLPLTLAIIEGLLVRVGRGTYALPLSAVEECVELPSADETRSRGRSFLNIRGELVPFLRLRDIFAVQTPPDPFQKVVVVSAGDLRVGLLVDQIVGSHQTVIKSLSKLHAGIGHFSGATILGDGTVALILDIPHLVETGQQREERLRAAQMEAA
ncbi:Signal transduction histidine kinase CheA [Rhodovastum atsumiense]|uniref:Chemotaxis protein CheA n=1 Tax=Rhodovastum atsumiense TaxID=504468 RepID=A0A5M6J0R3_9PROT|nr:chemotaxis protein CheA [Rhodovastum atsumiense]KAA5613789.1 chemotaxis protein CheA [Rhodovastum atsumiense]CAH2601881.1 Signal transduction histidine kinase CheA [Rhodovastum atsumiense]